MAALAAVALDAAVGKLVSELLGAVLEMKDRAGKYKPTLARMETTLKLIGPFINQIDELNRRLGRPKEETERLIEELKTGKELVLKCSDADSVWSFFRKARHQKELEAWNGSIPGFIELVLQAHGVRNGLETLMEIRKLPAKRIELEGVCSPPEPPALTVGLDVPLNELKLRLLRDHDRVSVLTVTGSGGAGKSTLAKKFCWDDQVKGKFKENIFFVTFGKTPKLNTIVQRLYQHTCYEMPELQNEEDAVNQLGHLLKQIGKRSPILLVLDDVWLGSESLVDKFEFQIANYKILVTSISAIKRFGPPLILKPLCEPDAVKLFLDSASLDQSRSAIVNKIVKGCGGSPLALRVTGRSLRNQDPLVWHNMAKKLSEGHSIIESSNDVLSCLQKSLDVMDAKTKECFRDLALFPEDQRIPATALVDILTELHNEDDVGAMDKIHKLVDLNMADIIVTRKVASDTVDYNYHYVMMHGLLRKLSIHETSQGPEDKRSRLIIDISGNNLPPWWTVDIEYPIAARILSISTDETFTSEWCNLQPTEVEAVVLNVRGKKCTLPKFMKKMNKLKILIITNYDFCPAELENFELLDHLSNLKRIRLEKVSIPFLSKTGVQLKNLQKCSFFMCNVNEAFKNSTVQDSEDMMPNLVEMSFDYCNMVELPVELSNVVFMKKLSITNCHKLSALPEGIGKLVNLESLRLSSCTGLFELPDSITSLHNLEFLDLSDCISLSKLPENIGELGKLERVNVRGCSGISELPSSIMDLKGLKHAVCDEGTAALWEPFRTILSGLRLEVVPAEFNLDFLSNLQL